MVAGLAARLVSYTLGLRLNTWLLMRLKRWACSRILCVAPIGLMLISLFILVLTGCDSPTAIKTTALKAIVWGACDGADHSQVATRCGRYYPYASYKKNTSLSTPTHNPALYISFAILTPHNAAHNAEPVVFMAGGPGEGGNTQGIKLERWRYWLLDNPIKRPLIVWDSRGNQGAWGYFECEAYRLWSLNQLTGITEPATRRDERDQLQLCVELWRKKIAGEGFQSFNSEQNARDILGALKALSYSKWHVLSVSYGSRVAQWLAALAPVQTQSLLLDSPHSWQTQSVLDHQRYWWQGFERFFVACGMRESCAQGMVVQEVFDAAIKRLDQKPVTVMFELDGYQYSAVIGAEIFAHVLFTFLYDPENYDRAAQLLMNVADEHFDYSIDRVDTDVLSQVLAQSYAKTANPWLYWLTQCNDNLMIEEHEHNNSLHPVKWQRFLGRGAQEAACHLLSANKDWRPPPQLIKRLPVLVLSGLLDPVTPAANAQAIAQQYQGVILHGATAGHGLFMAQTCSNVWLYDYWDKPDTLLEQLRIERSINTVYVKRGVEPPLDDPKLAKIATPLVSAQEVKTLGECQVMSIQ